MQGRKLSWESEKKISWMKLEIDRLTNLLSTDNYEDIQRKISILKLKIEAIKGRTD